LSHLTRLLSSHYFRQHLLPNRSFGIAIILTLTIYEKMLFAISPSSFRRLRGSNAIRQSSIRCTIAHIRGGQNDEDDQDEQERSATSRSTSNVPIPPPIDLQVQKAAEISLAQGYTRGFLHVFMENLVQRGYIQLTEKCGSVTQFVYNDHGQRTPLMADLVDEYTWNNWTSMSESAGSPHSRSNDSRSPETSSSLPVSPRYLRPNHLASYLESGTVVGSEDDTISDRYAIDDDDISHVTAMRHPYDISRSQSPATTSLLDLINSRIGVCQESESHENPISLPQTNRRRGSSTANAEDFRSEPVVREG
jgi:hypothetical protein